DRCEFLDPISMAALEARLSGGFPEPFAGEMAKRFEGPEPVGAVSLSALEHGLVDERSDELVDLRHFEPVTGTHRLCRFNVKAAGEYGEAAPQQSFGLAQELVAPVDRALERLLSGRQAAVAGAQRSEPRTESA